MYVDSVWCVYSNDALTRNGCTPRNLPVWQSWRKEFDAIEKTICLRYSLLPYIYSTAREVIYIRKHHACFVLDFAADKNHHDISNEYLFGNSILVAPVIDPMYASNVDTEDYSQVKTNLFICLKAVID